MRFDIHEGRKMTLYGLLRFDRTDTRNNFCYLNANLKRGYKVMVSKRKTFSKFRVNKWIIDSIPSESL